MVDAFGEDEAVEECAQFRRPLGEVPVEIAELRARMRLIQVRERASALGADP